MNDEVKNIECPIGCNHMVEWPTYRHVYVESTTVDGKPFKEGDCVILLPHHMIEGVWSALATVIGAVSADGTGFTKEHFAELDAAQAQLDAWKHSEYEDHTYNVVEMAMDPKDLKGKPAIKNT